MARSKPTLASTDIPSEAQPNNRFTIDVTVRQGGPDPIASDGSCTTPTLDILAWRTPVKLIVNGEVVDEGEMCVKSGKRKSTTLSTSLSQGSHEVKVVVYSVGGNAYDLEPVDIRAEDEVRQVVAVSPDARDPSRPTSTDRLTNFIQRVADAFGGTTQQVALGALLAVVVLVVI